MPVLVLAAATASDGFDGAKARDQQRLMTLRGEDRVAAFAEAVAEARQRGQKLIGFDSGVLGAGPGLRLHRRFTSLSPGPPGQEWEQVTGLGSSFQAVNLNGIGIHNGTTVAVGDQGTVAIGSNQPELDVQQVAGLENVSLRDVAYAPAFGEWICVGDGATVLAGADAHAMEIVPSPSEITTLDFTAIVPSDKGALVTAFPHIIEFSPAGSPAFFGTGDYVVVQVEPKQGPGFYALALYPPTNQSVILESDGDPVVPLAFSLVDISQEAGRDFYQFSVVDIDKVHVFSREDSATRGETRIDSFELGTGNQYARSVHAFDVGDTVPAGSDTIILATNISGQFSLHKLDDGDGTVTPLIPPPPAERVVTRSLNIPDAPGRSTRFLLGGEDLDEAPGFQLVLGEKGGDHLLTVHGLEEGSSVNDLVQAGDFLIGACSGGALAVVTGDTAPPTATAVFSAALQGIDLVSTIPDPGSDEIIVASDDGRLFHAALGDAGDPFPAGFTEITAATPFIPGLLTLGADVVLAGEAADPDDPLSIASIQAGSVASTFAVTGIATGAANGLAWHAASGTVLVAARDGLFVVDDQGQSAPVSFDFGAIEVQLSEVWQVVANTAGEFLLRVGLYDSDDEILFTSRMDRPFNEDQDATIVTRLTGHLGYRISGARDWFAVTNQLGYAGVIPSSVHVGGGIQAENLFFGDSTPRLEVRFDNGRFTALLGIDHNYQDYQAEFQLSRDLRKWGPAPGVLTITPYGLKLFFAFDDVAGDEVGCVRTTFNF